MTIKSVKSKDKKAYKKALDALDPGSFILILSDNVLDGASGMIYQKYQDYADEKDGLRVNGEFLKCYSTEINLIGVGDVQDFLLKPGKDRLITGPLQDVKAKFEQTFTLYKSETIFKYQKQVEKKFKKGLVLAKDFVE